MKKNSGLEVINIINFLKETKFDMSKPSSLSQMREDDLKFNAIKEGVKEAFLEKLKDVNIAEEVEMGVWSAFRPHVPEANDLKNIYFDAVSKANAQGKKEF